MRYLATLVIVLSVSACDSEAVKRCDEAIQSQLRSPSTYKRIMADEIYRASDQVMLVTIQYDAANAYGTPIRSLAYCDYDKSKGTIEANIVPD